MGGIEILIPGPVLETSAVDVSTGWPIAKTGLILYKLGIQLPY